MNKRIRVVPERAEVPRGAEVRWEFVFEDPPRGRGASQRRTLQVRFPDGSPFNAPDIILAVPVKPGNSKPVYVTPPVAKPGDWKYDVVATDGADEVEEDPWLIVT